MEAFETRRTVLCLGAPRVELVSAHPVAEADSFAPRVGGAVASVALVAARAGAPVALAGSVGDDEWGTWLQSRLSDAGVDTAGLAAVGPSRIAFVTALAVMPHGVTGPGLAGTDLRVADAAGLVIGAETLVEGEDRELTMHARSVALEHDVPIVFVPTLRLADWRTTADASASLNAVVPGALLVCVSAPEATVMTGEEDVDRAALALVKAGARLVVITLGAEGAILRGELRVDADGDLDASVAGASEVLAGTLLARLALSDFYPPVVAASLREAVAAARDAVAGRV